MSMQVNQPFKIELIHKNANTKYSRYLLNTFSFGDWLDFILKNYGKFIAFKVIELNVPTDSVKLINWLQSDFKQLFDYDPIMWFASVASFPEELHQYLIPFHKDN